MNSFSCGRGWQTGGTGNPSYQCVGGILSSILKWNNRTYAGLQWQGFAREASLFLALSNSVILSALEIAENYTFKYKKVYPQAISSQRGR